MNMTPTDDNSNNKTPEDYNPVQSSNSMGRGAAIRLDTDEDEEAVISAVRQKPAHLSNLKLDLSAIA